MTDSQVHDLAVAYAQTKLLASQLEHPEDSGYSEEIRAFLKWYHFAHIQIPKEDAEIDSSTLM